MTDNHGNEWPVYYADDINSSIIEIDYLRNESSDNKLIDKKRTYVYPNPVTDKLNIYTKGLSGTLEFSLMNIQGQQIKNKTFNCN